MDMVSARQKRDNDKKAAALQAVNDLANFLSSAKVVNKTGNCLSRDNTFFSSRTVNKTINKNYPGSPHGGISVLAKSANIVMTKGSKQLWTSVKNDLFKSYKEVGISPLHLHDCSMQKFLTMFIDDEAPHSLPIFQQEEIGDQHANATNWIDARDVEAAYLVKDYSKELELAAQNECEFYVREIVYCHPISMPMAPSSADAIKFQRLRRFGSCGVCIETITRVKDLPMTDSFFVEDIIIIEHSKSSDGSNDCVTLSARFQIRSVKYNVLQRLIERTTRSEFQDFFTGWRAMVSSVLMDEHNNSEVSDEQKKGPPILSESTSFDFSAGFNKFFSIFIEIAQREKMSVENLGKKNVPLWVIFIIAAIFALVYNSMIQHINTFESTLISLHLDVHNMKTWAQRIQSLKQSFRLLPNEQSFTLNDKNGNHPQIRDALPQGTTSRNEQTSTLTGSTKRKPRETHTIHTTNDDHKVVSRKTIHQNTRCAKSTVNDNHHPTPTQNDTIRNKCNARVKKKKNTVKKKKVTTKTITDEQYQQINVLDRFFGTDAPAVRKQKNKDPSSMNQHPQHKN